MSASASCGMALKLGPRPASSHITSVTNALDARGERRDGAASGFESGAVCSPGAVAVFDPRCQRSKFPPTRSAYVYFRDSWHL